MLDVASVTQHRDLGDARTFIDGKLAEGKTHRKAHRAHNATSPTESSDACGKTRHDAQNPLSPSRLDTRASTTH